MDAQKSGQGFLVHIVILQQFEMLLKDIPQGKGRRQVMQSHKLQLKSLVHFTAHF